MKPKLISKETWDKLYDYQRTGVQFFVEQSGLNADEVGLGKSPQALLAAEERGCKRVLIICLSSIKNMWQTEINTWLPGSTSIVVKGTEKEREEQIKSGARFTIVSFNQIRTRTTYVQVKQPDDTFKRVPASIEQKNLPSLANEKWDAIIIDEAHNLRNRKGKTFEAANHIRKKRRDVPLWATTGTPIHTKPEDLWPILHLVDPEKFSGFWKWADEYCTSAINFFSGFPEVTGVADIEKLRTSLIPYMVRRLKTQVRKDMPPVTYINIPVELEPVHMKLYKEMKKKMFIEYEGHTIEAVNALALGTRLKQICVSPDLLVPSDKLTGAKIEAILDTIDSLGDTQFVLFSQFSTVIERLYPLISKRAKVATYIGATKDKERTDILKRFGAGEEQGVLATTQTAGTGLNGLQVANVALFTDLMWAPASNGQAVGRLDRTGQLNPVTVYTFNTIDTIEGKIAKVLKTRDALFSSIIPETEVTRALMEYLNER